jgi:acyl-CoA reductase-like NAD-dependent aldehyde dehydrogenase
MEDTMNTVVSDHKVRKQLMLIGGEWVPAQSGDTIAVENPGRREIIATVPRGASEDVDLAVKKALAAFDPWRRTAPRERGRLLYSIAEKIKAEHESLARTIRRRPETLSGRRRALK